MFTTFLTSKMGVWLLETALPFFAKYWKQIIVIAMAVWIIICCFSHCGTRPQPVSTTVTVTDTVLIVDNSWHKLLGDTIAYFTAQMADRKWEAPAVNLVDAETCEDSLIEYKVAFGWASKEIAQCDSAYRADYRFRTFTKTLETDSFKLDYTINTFGILASAPEFKVNNKIPAKVITNTTTNTVVIQPRRKMFIGIGGGGQGNAIENTFQGVIFKVDLGYLDKRNNQYDLDVQYTSQNLYGVLFTYRRGFDFGK